MLVLRQKGFNSKAAKERNNKFFEALKIDDVREGGVQNKIVGNQIRGEKIHGQFISSYDKSINKRTEALNNYQKNGDADSRKKLMEAEKKVNKHYEAIRDNKLSSKIKAAKEAGNRMDTKVTSGEISRRLGRSLNRRWESDVIGKIYKQNEDKIPSKKPLVEDPLTKPLKDRMTPEKKRIIQDRLKEKAKEAQKLRNIKIAKRVGLGAAAVAGTAGLAYGAKKLYDKKKKEE